MQAQGTDFSTRICSHICSLENKQKYGNLFLAGVNCLKQKQIQDLKITAVLTIIDHWSYANEKIAQKIQHFQIKEHKWINLEDQEDNSIYPHLEQSCNLIESWLPKHNVVVHCQMGISRSSSLVIAYLMKKNGTDLKETRDFVKAKRKIIEPNDGFLKDLIKFQAYLKQSRLNK